MGNEIPQLPETKKPNELLKLLGDLAPFILYSCFFVILLLPCYIAGKIDKYSVFSLVMILGHFSALLNKIKNK